MRDDDATYSALMDWWNDIVSWLGSPDSRTTIFTAVILFVAILASGLLATWIGSASIKRLVSARDREHKGSAIAALVDAATEASVWNSLTPQEQALSDRAVGQADTVMRLLPIRGSIVAANWATHQLSEMKRNSATFGYQLDPAIAEFRDRLVDWQDKPRRARKLFLYDIERWHYAERDSEQLLDVPRGSWAAQPEKQPPMVTPAPIPAAADASAIVDPVPATTRTQQLLDDVDALGRRRDLTTSDHSIP